MSGCYISTSNLIIQNKYSKIMNQEPNNSQKIMRIFRSINDTLHKMDKMPPGERRAALDNLISVNERVSDFVVSLLNKYENVRNTEEVHNS